MRKLIGCVLLVAIFPTGGIAATITEQVESAMAAGKTTYIMMFRSNDQASRNMAHTVKSHATANSSRAAFIAVNINDKSQSELIQKFDATRLPMPTTFGVAPNGAVTGVFRLAVTRDQLAKAMLTPQYAATIKALQDQKIAVVCLLPKGSQAIPSGVTQFQQSADFKGKTERILVSADDVSEEDYFRRTKVATDIQSPVIMLFVPPGLVLGKFDANVLGETLAEKVHSSGKCNCKKCLHK